MDKKSLKQRFKETFSDIRRDIGIRKIDVDGIMGWSDESKSLAKFLVFAIGALLVILKFTMFYNFMCVGKGLLIILLMSFVMTTALMLVFKRKWIFGILYLLGSLFMIIDVNYFRFFNRALSIKALGAAGMVGGVMDSVKAMFMPLTLLLIVDAVIFLFVFIAIGKRKNREIQEYLFKRTSKIRIRIAALIAVVLLIAIYMFARPAVNSMGDNVLSHEFLSYHLRDFAGLNTSDGEIDVNDVLVMKGDYDTEKKGPDFGCGEGMNVIVIQVEAMQNFVIGREYNGQEITPFLNKLIKNDTFYFDSYYSQTGAGNTSDAELASNNSIYGSMQSYTYNLFQDNYWRGLPVLLCNSGYNTMGFHVYDPTYWNREGAYPNQGITSFYAGGFFETKPNEIAGMGISDKELFSQSMKILKVSPQPFYGFYVTLSSHHPFYIGEKRSDMDLLKKDKKTLFGNYMKSMKYVDECLERFFKDLEKNGLADNTIVVIYGDHLGMNPKTADVQKRMSEYLGWDYDYEDAMNVPLLIHVPNSGKHRKISTVGGQTDLLPTMAYLLGWDELDTIYFGHNLCTVKNNFVPVRSYVPGGSFLMGDVMFKMSDSGIISEAEAVDIRTHKKIRRPQRYETEYKKALQLQHTADYYIENNIMSWVYQHGYELENIVADSYNKGYFSEIEPQEEIVDASVSDGADNGIYSLENFNRLYDDGVRAFKLNLVWTNDGHTLVMNNIHEFDKYFDNGDSIDSYDEILGAKENNPRKGRTLMLGAELLNWAVDHRDAVFYISVDDDELVGGPALIESIYFARTLKSTYPDILDRTIFIADDVEEMQQYVNEGLYNVILQDTEDNDVKRLVSLAENNHLYGVEVNSEKAKKLARKWKLEDSGIYADITSDVAESADSLGVTGVVILP